jgi:hypothetical protein
MVVKVCSNCGIKKQIDQFYFKKGNRDSHDGKCKTCVNEERRNRYNCNEDHKEQIQKLNKKSYHKNIEARRAYDRQRPRIDYNKKTRERIKRECFSNYCDGEIRCMTHQEHFNSELHDVDVLTLDHINGGGRKMAEDIGIGSGAGGYRLYLYLKRNGYPKGFRVLCFNCQHKEAKRLGFFITSSKKY